MYKRTFLSTVIILMAIFNSSSQAELYDRAYIENFAKQQLAQTFEQSNDKKVSISIAPIDPRVVINPCESALSANIPQKHNSRNVNIQISCADSRPWSLFIPARVQIMVPVVIAQAAIDKGSLLTHNNLAIEWIDELKIRGEKMRDLSTLIGAKAKRNLMKGSAVTRRNICIVCKGDNVTIIAASPTLTIKTRGSAVSSGHIGDKVMVKNARSGKLVEAQVDRVNQVKIYL